MKPGFRGGEAPVPDFLIKVNIQEYYPQAGKTWVGFYSHSAVKLIRSKLLTICRISRKVRSACGLLFQADLSTIRHAAGHMAKGAPPVPMPCGLELEAFVLSMTFISVDFVPVS